eukprot:sb/3477233/
MTDNGQLTKALTKALTRPHVYAKPKALTEALKRTVNITDAPGRFFFHGLVFCFTTWHTLQAPRCGVARMRGLQRIPILRRDVSCSRDPNLKHARILPPYFITGNCQLTNL